MSRGLVLNDRYRLLERLATGGMGEVWRAADQALGREVAVKLLRRELMSDPSARERFRTEGMIAASLRHGGIAQVYDVGTVRGSGPDAGTGVDAGAAMGAPAEGGPEPGADEGRAYLVMELVRGEPLADILARVGALPADAVLDLVAQAGRALAVAHAAGIVHRDIKPANLMVTADGTVKITDFGIARRLAAASQTQTGMVMGTAYYLSPEQASGQGVTPSSDLYSLGVVAFECLAGRVPFDAATPVEVALGHVREAPPPLPASVPAPVRDLVGALLAKHPSSRPADADEVADRALVIRDAVGFTASGLARWARVRSAAPDAGDAFPVVDGPAVSAADAHGVSAAGVHAFPVAGGRTVPGAGADAVEPTTSRAARMPGAPAGGAVDPRSAESAERYAFRSAAPRAPRAAGAYAGGRAEGTETSRSGRRGSPNGARPVAGSGALKKDAVERASAAAVSESGALPGFDEIRTGDSLGRGAGGRARARGAGLRLGRRGDPVARRHRGGHNVAGVRYGRAPTGEPGEAPGRTTGRGRPRPASSGRSGDPSQRAPRSEDQALPVPWTTNVQAPVSTRVPDQEANQETAQGDFQRPRSNTETDGEHHDSVNSEPGSLTYRERGARFGGQGVEVRGKVHI